MTPPIMFGNTRDQLALDILGSLAGSRRPNGGTTIRLMTTRRRKLEFCLPSATPQATPHRRADESGGRSPIDRVSDCATARCQETPAIAGYGVEFRCSTDRTPIQAKPR